MLTFVPNPLRLSLSLKESNLPRPKRLVDLNSDSIETMKIFDINWTFRDEKAVRACRCGGTDHQRTWNKLCPLYRGSLKDQHKLQDVDEDTSVVKLGLQNALSRSLDYDQRDKIKNVLFDAVDRVTEIYCEASRFLNGYIIHCIESNSPVPSLEYNSSVVNRIFQAVFRKNLSNPMQRKQVACEDINYYADNIYALCRLPLLPWCDVSGISNIMQDISKQYCVNIMNHIQVNMFRFTKNFVRHKLIQLMDNFATRKNINCILNYIMLELSRDSDNYHVYRLPLEAVMFSNGKKPTQRSEQEVFTLMSLALTVWNDTREML